MALEQLQAELDAAAVRVALDLVTRLVVAGRWTIRRVEGELEAGPAEAEQPPVYCTRAGALELARPACRACLPVGPLSEEQQVALVFLATLAALEEVDT